MSIKDSMNSISLNLRNYSPEIMVISGVVGTIAGGIMACFATRKVDGVLSEHKKNADVARKADKSERKKAMTKVYAKTGAELVKLYAPAVIVEALSVTSILSGNHILRKRNVALAAAYTAVDTSFKKYRGRVVDRFGEEVDKELRAGTRKEEIEVEERGEDGETRKVKKVVDVLGKDLPSDYARYFAYGEARAAEPTHDYNIFFVKSQQELANHMLRSHGFLFLNEVYDMLGLERSIAGQAVGWVYDKDRDDHGDNYVDFGIQEVYRLRSDEDGDYEKVILLDFNVDGAILDHAENSGLISAR